MARHAVLVHKGSVAQVALHGVQLAGVVVGAAEGGVARHFGVKLVDAVAQQEAARVEHERGAVLGGVGARGQGELFNDCDKLFHIRFLFYGLYNKKTPTTIGGGSCCLSDDCGSKVRGIARDNPFTKALPK